MRRRNGNNASATVPELRFRDCWVIQITPDAKTGRSFTSPRWPSGKVLALGLEGSGLETRFYMKISRVRGMLHVKSYVVAKRPPVGVAWKFGDGVPAQASSLSSDSGSQLRGPSQNSPRASKRDVNITSFTYSSIFKMVNSENPCFAADIETLLSKYVRQN
ncbi:hypothetical protein AVEN_63140-1 [Araneus ventricosus]|uniref:Uncharacterized protein n=1 Tax=Araneus ventricosus TaxID=182803 RepID=A0A4Y2B1B8_ARAVE|nr:hypothetical protein AVEN_63140-1 [Araneus ventricosus]